MVYGRLLRHRSIRRLLIGSSTHRFLLGLDTAPYRWLIGCVAALHLRATIMAIRVAGNQFSITLFASLLLIVGGRLADGMKRTYRQGFYSGRWWWQECWHGGIIGLVVGWWRRVSGRWQVGAGCIRIGRWY